MNKINRFLYKHKFIIIASSLLTTSIIYTKYYRHKKQISSSLNNTKPQLTQILLNNLTNNPDIKQYISKVISSSKLQLTIINNMTQFIQSNELKTQMKNIMTSILHQALTKEEHITKLTEVLKEIIYKNEKLQHLSERFVEYVSEHYDTEVNCNQFWYEVLTDETFINAMSDKVMQCAYNALANKEFEKVFMIIVKEIMDNEKLMKYIFMKAVDVFNVNNKELKYKC